MKNTYDLLDGWIDRLKSGGPGQPDEELKTLLATAARVKEAYFLKPGAARRAMALERFERARAELARGRRDGRPLLSRLRFSWLAWAAGAAAFALAVAGYLALRPESVPMTLVNADPQGNLVFLISDEENAIADFASLRLKIDRVGLLGDDGAVWIEFVPEIDEVDLTLLAGSLNQAVWQVW